MEFERGIRAWNLYDRPRGARAPDPPPAPSPLTTRSATCLCPVYNVKEGAATRFTISTPTGKCAGTKGFRVGSIMYNGLGLYDLSQLGGGL